jgi:hypothetical protein
MSRFYEMCVRVALMIDNWQSGKNYLILLVEKAWEAKEIPSVENTQIATHSTGIIFALIYREYQVFPIIVVIVGLTM